MQRRGALDQPVRVRHGLLRLGARGGGQRLQLGDVRAELRDEIQQLAVGADEVSDQFDDGLFSHDANPTKPRSGWIVTLDPVPGSRRAWGWVAAPAIVVLAFAAGYFVYAAHLNREAAD